LSRVSPRGFTGLGMAPKLFLLVLLGAFLFFEGPARGESAPSTTEATTSAATVQDGAGAQAGQQAGEAQEEGAPEAAAGEEDHAEEGHEAPHATDFFLILIAILVFAKVFGEGAERIGQPAVLGELIAGLVLGGSVLGIVPTGTETLMGEVIHFLAEVGVAILLFEIGLETDLKEMFRVGKSSTMVAMVGVFLPFLLGFAYWFYFDPSPGVMPSGVEHWMVAVFIGATLTATSVGITARVLTDLGLMHRQESRIIIGAAVIDDVLGLVILAVVSSLAAGAALTALGITWTLVVAVGFLVVAVIVGNFIAPSLFQLIDRMSVRGVLLVSAFCFALLFAALAHKAGSAMIIGAFAAGIVLSSTNQFDLIVERIEPVADVFTPIFFVSVGAAVNVNLFIPGTEAFNSQVLVVGWWLIFVAVIGKLVAGYVVGWGSDKLNHAAIGIGMVPRGEVGLIFAQIGLTNGIMSNETFSAVLIMVIVTTFIAPPALKIFFTPDQDDLRAQEIASS